MRIPNSILIASLTAICLQFSMPVYAVSECDFTVLQDGSEPAMSNSAYQVEQGKISIEVGRYTLSSITLNDEPQFIERRMDTYIVDMTEYSAQYVNLVATTNDCKFERLFEVEPKKPWWSPFINILKYAPNLLKGL
ncbi:hypothetical protein [Vibrio owensii]|uniref:hypothetical protein n=1 Tax=Vibrio harveyi group TaxID=717610 RepID=UPI003CC681DA